MLPAFFSITVSFFTELPISTEEGVIISPALLLPAGIQGHVAIITRLRINCGVCAAA